MKRPLAASLLATIIIGVPACQENSPTSVDPGGAPVAIETFEIDLPWEIFGDGLQVLGGFGSAAGLSGSIVAHEFRGALESRVLVEVARFPNRVEVRDPDGVLVSDRDLEFVSGRVVARLDTVGVGRDPDGLLNTLEFRFGELDQTWDARTATWDLAADTFGVEQPWNEPGAGPVVATSDASWTLESGDSLVIEIPSQTIMNWSDSLAHRGFRLDLATSNERVRITDVQVRLDVRPSVRPDTLVQASVASTNRTFVYSPTPGASESGIRIGGVPAFRTVVGLDVPTELDGPAELCAIVGCPYRIDPSNLNRAALILTSRESEPEAFQPIDSVYLDARPVLAPDELPKSPLGPSLLGGRSFGPSAFGDQSGQKLELPMTAFIRALIDPDSDGSTPTDIALLSLFEPIDISFAEFDGPGDPGSPILRLLITVTDTVRIR